jgi:ADP-heptose:LPS heptosyltransferase
MPPRKVIVLRPGALGDGVVTFPVLASLRAAWPEAQVLAIGSPVFQLAAEAGLATDWMAFDDARLTGLFAEGGRSALFGDCGLCIAYVGKEDPLLAANLRASGAGEVILWPASPSAGVHIVDHLLAVLDGAGVNAVTRRPRLDVQERWIAEGRRLLEGCGVRDEFVAIHPGSGGRRKQWGGARFAEMAQRLGERVAWLLGPAEREDMELRRIGERVGAVVEPGTLSALAGVLACSRAYVGNDSGASHLAAALGARTVVVFGPTDPVVWGPRGERVVLLGGPAQGGFDAVQVEDVLAAAAEMGGGDRQDGRGANRIR